MASPTTFGVPGNPVLDRHVAEVVDNLRIQGADLYEFPLSGRPWRDHHGMRQEVDIRYVVTSLKGSAQDLYEDEYCQRGQMANLIKLHRRR